jgi:SAM-dependent methyltransferase
MPTPPNDLDRLQRNREIAESFGDDPERYDRSRPSYPAVLVQRVLAAGPGRDVLDVGTGTGITARLFQAAGCTVLGVEVDERMAEFARRAGTVVEVSPIEAWDPAGRSFDAVVAGQCWHWVVPVAGAVKAAEALRPGGLFAAFWNVQQPSPEAAAAFAQAYRRHAPEQPYQRPGFDFVRAYLGMCERTAQGLRAVDGAFGEPEIWRFEWDQTYTRDEWLDVVPTHGGFSLIPRHQQVALLAELGHAIDELGGGFEMHYTTVALTATRFPSSPARGEPHAPSAMTVPGATDKERAPTPEA